MDVKCNLNQIQFIWFHKLKIFKKLKILSMMLKSLNNVYLNTLEIDFPFLIIIIHVIMVIL